MITGELRNKIDRIWETFWTGGINLTTFIYDMYELYHVERLENAFIDIDSLMTKGVPAW